jgi:hypothetical protein
MDGALPNEAWQFVLRSVSNTQNLTSSSTLARTITCLALAIRWCIQLTILVVLQEIKSRLMSWTSNLGENRGQSHSEPPYLQAVQATCSHGDSATDRNRFPERHGRKQESAVARHRCPVDLCGIFSETVEAPTASVGRNVIHLNYQSIPLSKAFHLGKELEKTESSVVVKIIIINRTLD